MFQPAAELALFGGQRECLGLRLIEPVQRHRIVADHLAFFLDRYVLEALVDDPVV